VLIPTSLTTDVPGTRARVLRGAASSFERVAERGRQDTRRHRTDPAPDERREPGEDVPRPVTGVTSPTVAGALTDHHITRPMPPSARCATCPSAARRPAASERAAAYPSRAAARASKRRPIFR
jgi:hypothetical protein